MNATRGLPGILKARHIYNLKTVAYNKKADKTNIYESIMYG